MNIVHIIMIFLSYCFGSIPFGILITRHTGIDIRSQGSGNIGATNVARLFGKKMGVLTLFLDMLKGFLPLFFSALIVQGQPHSSLIIALCGAASVLGHMFSLFLSFKGGKGVATALGVFIYLSPLAILGCLLVFVATVALSGFVSLGSLLASASMLVFLVVFKAAVWKIGLAAFVVLMIWIKHHENIKRLLSGTEKSWKKRD